MSTCRSLLSASFVALVTAETSLRGASIWNETSTAETTAEPTQELLDESFMLPENESFAGFAAMGFDGNGFCRTKGREGQNCISERAYVYCSAGRELKALSRDCWGKRGRLSRCHEGGIGLTHGECDDPFCRQQSGRRSHYCRNNAVVDCSGTGSHTGATPRVVQVCSDRTSERDGCKVTHHFSCAESSGRAECQFSGSTSDGDGCRGGGGGGGRPVVYR